MRSHFGNETNDNEYMKEANSKIKKVKEDPPGTRSSDGMRVYNSKQLGFIS